MREALRICRACGSRVSLVFGRPTEQQRHAPNRPGLQRTPSSARIPYRDRNDERTALTLTTRAAANGQQNYDFTTAIQAFCKRKYESDFSRK